MNIILTERGKRTVQGFIRECEAKRKEILDAGIDTAEMTVLPTEEDILSDIACFMDDDGDYFNSWGVTDAYNSDNLLTLQKGVDFTFQPKTGISLVTLLKQEQNKMKAFYVTYKVEGRFEAEVQADSIEKAREKAQEVFCEADFGQLQDIDGEDIIVEDRDGNFLWER